MRASMVIGAAIVCLASVNVVGASTTGHPNPETGVSSHAIKLGSVIDQTGRGTVISLHVLAGYKLAVSEINAHGGVLGRRVDFNAVSDNYDPSQTLAQTKQLVESDGVFGILGIFGSDDGNAALPYLETKHVPFFDPIGGGAAIQGKHWVWQTEPSYAREGQVMARFLATSLHARRVAVLYQVGIGEPQRDAIKKALPRYHALYVGAQSYSSTDSNLSAQVLRLRALRPDIVVLNGTPTPTTAFVQDARLAGYKPRLGYLANYPMGDPLWIQLVGPSVAEGTYVSSYADLTGRNRVAAAYRKAIATYHGETYSNYGLYGYFNATLFFQALRETGKHLTRSGLQKVLNSRFRHYDTGFAGTLTWTPGQRYGARTFKIYRIHNGAFVPITPFLKP